MSHNRISISNNNPYLSILCSFAYLKKKEEEKIYILKMLPTSENILNINHFQLNKKKLISCIYPGYVWMLCTVTYMNAEESVVTGWLRGTGSLEHYTLFCIVKVCPSFVNSLFRFIVVIFMYLHYMFRRFVYFTMIL